MPNNKIANPTSPAEQQAQQTPQMTDRDRLNDILATEKYLTDGFNIATREASHESLHRDTMTCLTETQQCARDIFNLMFQKGWYTLEAEDQQKLDQTYQQFSGYTSQFPYSGHMQ
ncbi:spore coat protein [Aneurinibacillus sp. REN35]|uniref:spore coat protein n=1 Tax=Aneurinibacillus sp. REN35 TaxID=3237286 RepID=UPI0035273D56